MSLSGLRCLGLGTGRVSGLCLPFTLCSDRDQHTRRAVCRVGPRHHVQGLSIDSPHVRVRHGALPGKGNESRRNREPGQLPRRRSQLLSVGADGLQTYNYQQMAPGYGARPEHYATDQWSEALGWLTELRDPALVAEGDRHYAFHTLWWPDDRGVEGECLGKNEFGFPYTSPIIRLDCIHWASHLHGAVRFRLAEDLTRANLTATLRFKAVGLAEEDALQIELNGFEISDDCVTRPRHTFDDLQFYQYSLDMHREAVAPIVAKGDNQLALRLLSNRSENGGAVTVGDLEVSVSVRGV